MRLPIPWKWRLGLQVFWYRADAGAWIFGAVGAALAGAFAVGVSWLFAEHEARRERQVREHRENLHCLARNIYFEARGEPVAGQYAVAEVTMNRKGAGLFPRSVCEVVYERAAFSWTLSAVLPEPAGTEWALAQEVAEAVYYGRHTPTLRGARFYHATYVQPGWARTKKRVAQIGRHIFYQ
jgi:N-acetylmuramoyl-L-alanine amidase